MEERERERGILYHIPVIAARFLEQIEQIPGDFASTVLLCCPQQGTMMSLCFVFQYPQATNVPEISSFPKYSILSFLSRYHHYCDFI